MGRRCAQHRRYPKFPNCPAVLWSLLKARTAVLMKQITPMIPAGTPNITKDRMPWPLARMGAEPIGWVRSECRLRTVRPHPKNEIIFSKAFGANSTNSPKQSPPPATNKARSASELNRVDCAPIRARTAPVTTPKRNLPIHRLPLVSLSTS